MADQPCPKPNVAHGWLSRRAGVLVGGGGDPVTGAGIGGEGAGGGGCGVGWAIVTSMVPMWTCAGTGDG
jgi:hypothetical protein